MPPEVIENGHSRVLKFRKKQKRRKIRIGEEEIDYDDKDSAMLEK